MSFGVKYPIVMEFLNSIFGDKDITKYFIKSIAYGLLMKKQHKVLLFYSQNENNGHKIINKLLDDLYKDKNYKYWLSVEYSDDHNCLSSIIKKDKKYDNFNWIIQCKNMLPSINIKIRHQVSIFLLSNMIELPLNYDIVLDEFNNIIRDEIFNMTQDVVNTYIEVPENIQNNIYLIDAI